MAADPAEPELHTPAASGALARLHAVVHDRTAHLDATRRAMIWAATAGLCFAVMNTIARTLAQQLEPLLVQFLRHFFGMAVMLPLVWRSGAAAFRPAHVGGQLSRGALHTVGLAMWFLALPHIPLADTTAMGFIGPIFVLMGATIFLGERMRWERWLATAAGFLGVLIVVGPSLSGSGGSWHLLMLASSPVFAASFLFTKVLLRRDRPEVVVLWQSLTVSLCSLPLALWVWAWPSAQQWLAFATTGLFGSLGHYCTTRSLRHAEVSATQSVKFLDLVWAALLGFVVFADVPTVTTLVGGVVISMATVWLARRESRFVAAAQNVA